MNDITQPLRLAVGSHRAGSGKGCAMNVISWETGESTITDMPACADPFLARVVQRVNDSQCAHSDGDLLCPPCSVKVLELGHRTVGTNLAALGWDSEEIRRVWVEIAVEQAESVARENEDPRVTKCRAVTRAWLRGEAAIDKVHEARSDAADAAYAAYAAYAADAAYAYAAATATATAYAAATAYAYATAATAATAAAAADAADAAYGYGSRLWRAHRIVDRFEELTGVRAEATPTETTARAYAAMTA